MIGETIRIPDEGHLLREGTTDGEITSATIDGITYNFKESLKAPVEKRTKTMESIELKTGDVSYLRLVEPDKDGDFEVEIYLGYDSAYCYLNKDNAIKLRDFLNQFLESE